MHIIKDEIATKSTLKSNIAVLIKPQKKKSKDKRLKQCYYSLP